MRADSPMMFGLSNAPLLALLEDRFGTFDGLTLPAINEIALMCINSFQ